MSYWIILWKVCLIVALAVFSLMAVLVTIKGWLDVRLLLKRLTEADAEPEDESEHF